MEAPDENGVELEIREHSDVDFFPKRCPLCYRSAVRRSSYRIRIIQDLGSPHLCRRVRYERVFFLCKHCEKVFTVEHPLIQVNSKYMPGVIEYAVTRVLQRKDSIKRVTEDLNDLHHVKVSYGTVQKWVNKHGKKEEISEDFSEEDPPEDFSGFMSLDGTFKAVSLKKNDLKMDR
ncbi:MAG: IS1 family transposase [Promethearchaeota archaeon]|nr:MAG: IS1 family transposase [Candidatus Lokiarchaeota archaeon]